MKKTIPIGVVNYEQLRKENYYFVDKSMMISDFLKRKNTATLITRPRRFGKTINLSMMASFFDITKNSKELFEDTQIMGTEYAVELNQYPTIFISFADAKGDLVNIVRQIKNQLQNEYRRFDYLFKNLNEFDKNDYQSIKKDLMDKNNGKIEASIDALSFLMVSLERYYNQKVMVLIDEYDTPFIEAHVGGFYNEIKNGLSNMLHNALKTSTSLQYAMLTGIQRVAKENIFSDLNNLVVCTVKDKEYSNYFGFTEEETKAVLEYYDLELNKEVKEMYNGYKFGECEIYNPWSVLNYAFKKSLEPYWVNTSGNKMIRNAMEKSNQSFKQDYEKLIQTGRLETFVKMDTSFYEVNNTESLWGLLVNAGYLTITETISLRDRYYVLKIPNEEVQDEFKNLTAYYLNLEAIDLYQLFNNLKYERIEDFEKKYQEILLTIPSYYDLKDENSYHMMVLGMCAWLKEEYEISSNQEVGKGRCDIILKSKHEQYPSYVLEFKYTKDSNVNLDKLADIALKQIEERNYDIKLKGKVVRIGLAHYQKEVAIKWKEKQR